MRKSTKWTLIGLGIFVLVVMVVASSFFISSAVVAAAMEGFSSTIAEQVKKEIPKALTETEIREIIREEIPETTAQQTTISETTTVETTALILKSGQELIYDGKKIMLTKYDILPTNIDKNLLWVYLYVENIDNVPHEHIHSEEFVIYDKGRKDGILCGAPGLEEGRKLYDTGSYDKLNPGEICEGWTSYYIEADWKAEDIEIHFEPLFGGTGCIWLLK